MTNKEILEEVYRRLKETTDNGFEVHNFTIVTSFIEQEWQKQDDQELLDQYYGSRAEDWIIDVAEIERHRGLEIGEDGTVTGLK